MPTTEELRNLIVKTLKLGPLSGEERNGVIFDLTEQILKRVSLELLSKLPESARPEFENYQKEGKVDEMFVFLRKHIPDMDEAVSRVAKSTIDEYRSHLQ